MVKEETRYNDIDLDALGVMSMDTVKFRVYLEEVMTDAVYIPTELAYMFVGTPEIAQIIGATEVQEGWYTIRDHRVYGYNDRFYTKEDYKEFYILQAIHQLTKTRIQRSENGQGTRN